MILKLDDIIAFLEKKYGYRPTKIVIPSLRHTQSIHTDKSIEDYGIQTDFVTDEEKAQKRNRKFAQCRYVAPDGSSITIYALKKEG